MSGIEVVCGSLPPKRCRVGALLAPLVRHRKTFGELLGAMIVDEVARSRGLDVTGGPTRRLLGGGSVAEMARAGDVVWGSGVSGRSTESDADYSGVDVRAVRGPLTAAWLRERGAEVPEVFGDPALLVAELWPATRRERCKRWDYTVIPDVHDAKAYRHNVHATLPHWPFADIRRRILGSELVVSTSMYGLVVADAYGIPARLIRPGTQSLFEYEDYYRGTGRGSVEPALDVKDALRMGGAESLTCAGIALDVGFPHDLWSNERASGESLTGLTALRSESGTTVNSWKQFHNHPVTNHGNA